MKPPIIIIIIIVTWTFIFYLRGGGDRRKNSRRSVSSTRKNARASAVVAVATIAVRSFDDWPTVTVPKCSVIATVRGRRHGRRRICRRVVGLAPRVEFKHHRTSSSGRRAATFGKFLFNLLT